MVSAWDETDERVLRWAFERPTTLEDAQILELELSEPEPFPELPGINSRQVSKALYRLASADLITAEFRDRARYVDWWHIRVAPLGLIVLGEWPDLERIASAVGIRELLLELAGAAKNDDDEAALRRAAGLVGRTGSDVVRQTIATLAADATKEAFE
jgi:hypothetical protein